MNIQKNIRFLSFYLLFFFVFSCTEDNKKENQAINQSSIKQKISQSDPKKKFTFGVVPQQSATKLARTWIPLLDNISEKTGIRLEFRTEKDISTFEKELFNEGYDISYMNPYHYIFFNKLHHYQVFLKRKNKPIKGIIVVRKDSSYCRLKDFHKQKLAFPSPAAFAASILTQAQFKLLNIDIAPSYVSSHDSVYRAVAKGLYPGGGGVIRTFSKVDQQVKNQLKILWTSKGYTPHAWAAHPRVPNHIIRELAQFMILLVDDPQGFELLKTVGLESGLINAVDKDYDDIRALKLDSLEKAFGK